MDLSIVVPVYNGEHTIRELTRQIKEELEATSFSYEVIFVSDCGPDNSWEVIQQLVKENKELVKEVVEAVGVVGVVKGIKLSRNFGQHNAILAGIKIARGDSIITMDEDLQHSPKDIKRLIEKQKETGADVIYGKYATLEHSMFRNMTSKLMKKLLQMSLPELHPEYSAFRLIKKDVAKEITKMNNSYTFLDGYLSWITTNVDYTIVSHNERLEGESSYSVKKLVEHSINIFVTFSNFPIRFLTKFSFLIFIATFIYSLYVVFRKLVFDDLAMGFPTLIIVLGIGIGSIMLGMGILGEYLYRVNLKTTKRPNYFVKKIIE